MVAQSTNANVGTRKRKFHEFTAPDLMLESYSIDDLHALACRIGLHITFKAYHNKAQYVSLLKTWYWILQHRGSTYLFDAILARIRPRIEALWHSGLAFFRSMIEQIVNYVPRTECGPMLVFLQTLMTRMEEMRKLIECEQWTCLDSVIERLAFADSTIVPKVNAFQKITALWLHELSTLPAIRNDYAWASTHGVKCLQIFAGKCVNKHVTLDVIDTIISFVGVNTPTYNALAHAGSTYSVERAQTTPPNQERSREELSLMQHNLVLSTRYLFWGAKSSDFIDQFDFGEFYPNHADTRRCSSSQRRLYRCVNSPYNLNDAVHTIDMLQYSALLRQQIHRLPVAHNEPLHMDMLFHIRRNRKEKLKLYMDKASFCKHQCLNPDHEILQYARNHFPQLYDIFIVTY